jgi:hypothetical protein
MIPQELQEFLVLIRGLILRRPIDTHLGSSITSEVDIQWVTVVKIGGRHQWLVVRDKDGDSVPSQGAGTGRSVQFDLLAERRTPPFAKRRAGRPAKDFKEFIRISGMTHVRTSRYYLQSNGKIERWHKSLKGECIRPGTPLSLEDARRLIKGYVEHYNNIRLNSAIGYITPKDMLAGHQQ